MRFAPKIDDGHRGPKYVQTHAQPFQLWQPRRIPTRQYFFSDSVIFAATCRRFFRHILPRIKYRNPALPITVDRSAAQSDPAILNVVFKDDSASTSAPAPAAEGGDRVVTIQMKHKSESEILRQLYEVTGAKEVEPTDVEQEELRQLTERKERSRKDSERMFGVNRQRKREAEMLAAARGEVGINPA